MGKLTLFGIAVLAVLFTIATRIDRAELLTLAWIVLIIAVAVIVSIITFALKHPEYATLEGMEAVTMSAQLGTNKGLIRDITPEAREKGPNPLIIDTDATSTN